MARKLVLLRHGQSQWNQENLFTGWADVDLTDQGRGEAAKAARLLAAEGLQFDMAFTSVLKRAIRTLWIVMDGMDRMWVPVWRAWQLNERHYGALEGLNKAETAVRHGVEQVEIWRRGFDVAPPPVDLQDPRHPSNDPRYAALTPEELPATEALWETLARVESFWSRHIVPRLREGQTILVVAHGNSLRALIKILEGLSDKEIARFNIPTGVPLLYELDENLRWVARRYLGDATATDRATK